MANLIPDKPATLAFLVMPSGTTVRQACVGCCDKLHKLGLLDLTLIDSSLGECRSHIYHIAAGHTLEECRAAIKDRHVPNLGNPLNGDGE